MKVLFITNIPNPYRNDFYNELGKHIDLTVVYEATGAKKQGIRFNWNKSDIKNYRAIFLKDGNIVENKIDKKIFNYLSLEYDYIVVTNYYYRTEMAAIAYLKLHQIPFIMEIDGGILKPENRIKYFLKYLLIKGAETYFSPSAETDRFLLHYGATSNCIIRYPFSSLSENSLLKKPLNQIEKNLIRTELGITEKKIIVGVGRLIEGKGWDNLLNIANVLDYGIYIVGEGVLRDQLVSFCKIRHIENVHFVGFKSNIITEKYYKAADLFVLPTRSDVWGLVINEAMACGLPVITTENCGAGKELIKNGINGYLVPVDNEKALKDAIELVFQEKETMGVEAIKSIQNYTIESMARAHINFFLKHN